MPRSTAVASDPVTTTSALLAAGSGAVTIGEMRNGFAARKSSISFICLAVSSEAPAEAAGAGPFAPPERSRPMPMQTAASQPRARPRNRGRTHSHRA